MVERTFVDAWEYLICRDGAERNEEWPQYSLTAQMKFRDKRVRLLQRYGEVRPWDTIAIHNVILTDR